MSAFIIKKARPLSPYSNRRRPARFHYSHFADMEAPFLTALNDAFDEIPEWRECCGLKEEWQPDALLLVHDPRQGGMVNARARIDGDPEYLVQVLAMALRAPENAEFRTAFCRDFPAGEFF